MDEIQRLNEIIVRLEDERNYLRDLVRKLTPNNDFKPELEDLIIQIRALQTKVRNLEERNK